MDFLITIGHLGKDVGAVSPYDSDESLLPQQERYINKQQVIGCLIAYLADESKKPNIKFAIPKTNDKNELIYLAEDLNGNDSCIIEVDGKFNLEDRYNLANNLDRWLIEFHNNATRSQASGAEIICYNKRSKGYDLGCYVLQSITKSGFIRNRGVKTQKDINRNLAILTNTVNPAIILEGGFLTNRNEILNLDVDLDGFNDQYGLLVYRGIKKYWKENEANT